MVSILQRILAVSWLCFFNFFFFKPQTLCCKRVKRRTPETHSRHVPVCFVAVSVPRLSQELWAFNLDNLALCIQPPGTSRHCSSSLPPALSLSPAQVRPSPKTWRFWGWAQALEQTTLGSAFQSGQLWMGIVNKLLFRKHGALKRSFTLNIWLLVRTWLKTSTRTWCYMGLFLGISVDSAGRWFCCMQCILCSQGSGGAWICRGRGESALWNAKADAWLHLERLWR